jgi:hypothetical protein
MAGRDCQRSTFEGPGAAPIAINTARLGPLGRFLAYRTRRRCDLRRGRLARSVRANDGLCSKVQPAIGWTWPFFNVWPALERIEHPDPGRNTGSQRSTTPLVRARFGLRYCACDGDWNCDGHPRRREFFIRPVRFFLARSRAIFGCGLPLTSFKNGLVCSGERRSPDQARGHANVPDGRPAHGPGRRDDRRGRHVERSRGVHHLQGREKHQAVVSRAERKARRVNRSPRVFAGQSARGSGVERVGTSLTRRSKAVTWSTKPCSWSRTDFSKKGRTKGRLQGTSRETRLRS